MKLSFKLFVLSGLASAPFPAASTLRGPDKEARSLGLEGELFLETALFGNPVIEGEVPLAELPLEGGIRKCNSCVSSYVGLAAAVADADGSSSELGSSKEDICICSDSTIVFPDASSTIDVTGKKFNLFCESGNCILDGQNNPFDLDLVLFFTNTTSEVDLTFSDIQFYNSRRAVNLNDVFGKLQVKNCVFAGLNEAIRMDGLGGTASLTVADSTFLENRCRGPETVAPAIVMRNIEAEITSSLFSGNLAPNPGGLAGAIYISESKVEFNGCSFLSNTDSSNNGVSGAGAIRIQNRSNVGVFGSVFAGNEGSPPDNPARNARRNFLEDGTNTLACADSTFIGPPVSLGFCENQPGVIRVPVANLS